MVNVLFVCLGNICRSPMAEYVFRHHVEAAGLASQIATQSAGTSGWHNGEDMHKGTRAQLMQHSIDASGFRSSQIQDSDLNQFDYIIAMDNANLAELERRFGQHPHKMFKLTDLLPESGYSEVPDPWYTGNFDETYHLADIGSRALLNKIMAERLGK